MKTLWKKGGELCCLRPRLPTRSLRNASRTNKTSSSGIVREAQREASTEVGGGEGEHEADRGRLRRRLDLWGRDLEVGDRR